MKIITALRKDLFLIQLTDEEVDEIYQYVNLDDEGIEIWKGENTLETNTLWLIYSEINRLRHYTPVLLKVRDDLRKMLLPSQQEESGLDEKDLIIKNQKQEIQRLKHILKDLWVNAGLQPPFKHVTEKAFTEEELAILKKEYQGINY